MQHTVILVLSSMVAIVAVILVFLLWRAYRRCAWRQRWQAVGTMGWMRDSSPPSERPAGPSAYPHTPVVPSAGNARHQS